MVMEVLRQLVNDLFVWIGFGTLAGLLAKALVPGKDPGGTVATLLMGIGGAFVGAALVSFFWTGHHVSPLTPLGFIAAILGSSLLLVSHRLLSGRFFREEGSGVGVAAVPKRRRRVTVTPPLVS